MQRYIQGIFLTVGVIYLIHFFFIYYKTTGKQYFDTYFTYNYEHDKHGYKTTTASSTSSTITRTTSSYKSDAKLKYIYYGTARWGNENFLGRGQKSFLGCPENRCSFTTDSTRLNSSDAVLMHLNNIKELPPYRPPHQLYICFVFEPPYNVRGKVNRYRHAFNLTWSYQSDADFHKPIGKIEPMTLDEKNEVIPTLPRNFAAGKTELVAWTVGRCEAESGRQWVAQELKKFVSVHIYGRCGDYDMCPKGVATNTCNEDQTFANLYKVYKFYLAFENSLCKDYITEKLWRTMKAKHAIPIVLGGADYAADLPPHSYIDVHDFTSIEDLGKYLKILDKNDTLYNEYFAWKRENKVVFRVPQQKSICDFCSFLHNHNPLNNEIKVDLAAWYGVDTACINKSVHFKNMKGSPWIAG